ncbi:hypothetical protein RUND412_006658 [Rhizina undulata]
MRGIQFLITLIISAICGTSALPVAQAPNGVAPENNSVLHSKVLDSLSKPKQWREASLAREAEAAAQAAQAEALAAPQPQFHSLAPSVASPMITYPAPPGRPQEELKAAAAGRLPQLQWGTDPSGTFSNFRNLVKDRKVNKNDFNGEPSGFLQPGAQTIPAKGMIENKTPQPPQPQGGFPQDNPLASFLQRRHMFSKVPPTAPPPEKPSTPELGNFDMEHYDQWVKDKRTRYPYEWDGNDRAIKFIGGITGDIDPEAEGEETPIQLWDVADRGKAVKPARPGEEPPRKTKDEIMTKEEIMTKDEIVNKKEFIPKAKRAIVPRWDNEDLWAYNDYQNEIFGDWGNWSPEQYGKAFTFTNSLHDSMDEIIGIYQFPPNPPNTPFNPDHQRSTYLPPYDLLEPDIHGSLLYNDPLAYEAEAKAEAEATTKGSKIFKRTAIFNDKNKKEEEEEPKKKPLTPSLESLVLGAIKHEKQSQQTEGVLSHFSERPAPHARRSAVVDVMDLNNRYKPSRFREVAKSIVTEEARRQAAAAEKESNEGVHDVIQRRDQDPFQRGKILDEIPITSTGEFSHQRLEGTPVPNSTPPTSPPTQYTDKDLAQLKLAEEAQVEAAYGEIRDFLRKEGLKKNQGFHEVHQEKKMPEIAVLKQPKPSNDGFDVRNFRLGVKAGHGMGFEDLTPESFGASLGMVVGS